MPFPTLKPGINDLNGATFKKWIMINFKGDPNNPIILTNAVLVDMDILNCSHIVLRGVTIKGDDTNAPVQQLAVKALTIRGSSHITVEKSDISRSQVGLVAISSSYLTVDANKFHDNRDDVHLVNSEFYTIRRNEFCDHKNAVGDHPDAIQVWTDKGLDHAALGCVIEDNCIHRGNGGWMQGVFIRSYTQAQKPGWKAPTGLQVRNNLMIGTSPNGIAVCGDGTVLGNEVWSFSDKMSKIVIQGKYGLSGNKARRFTINGVFSTKAPIGNSLNNLVKATDEAALVAQWRQRVLG